MKKLVYKKINLPLIILFFTIYSPLFVHASQTHQIDLLGQTKSILPTSQNSDILYSGFATRIKNLGTITTIKAYYVLSENSNLTCHIMDTDLNLLYSTQSQYTTAGCGYISFNINNFTTSNTEIYIALESDKKSLGLGTVQEASNVTGYVTSDNSISGIENAQKNASNGSWHKEHGSLKGGISLYLEVYGSFHSEPFSQKKIYVSSSYGNNNNDGLSQKNPLKTISHALTLYPSNANIYLKSGDLFFEPNGLQLNGSDNLTITSYGGTETPQICGLQPSLLIENSKNLYSFSIPNDIGHLILSNKVSWKRLVTNRPLQNDGEYFVDISKKRVLLFLEQKPINHRIYYSNAAHGISIKNSSNINIANLEICNYGKHGISIAGYSTNIAIHKNIIHDIGGSLLNDVKYGNGIECWLNGLSDISISQNTVYNCFDAGITPQIKSSESYTNTNILISKNEIYNCTYPIEYFNASTSNSSCKNIIISSNYIHDCIDITNGYRESAATSYNAFFCMWRSTGNDNVIVKDNICINSDGYSASFSKDSYGKISFNDNVLITNKKQSIKNIDYFYGENNHFYNILTLPNKSSIKSFLSNYHEKGLALIG
ncbi:MAG: right-handed parallel beta-helix repeat-containing protein [Lachnospiraceae bacterium]|nr:right-handed parallel beta-helix repeat-containing protein [Lachnospiraceae bacterium]